MTTAYDVACLGNAIVDVIAPATDAFLEDQGLPKGSMTLVDEAWAARLHERMAAGVEASGGSAANTAAGVASLGGRSAFMGRVADDRLGEVYAADMASVGVAYPHRPLSGGPATGRCLINVTPDGQRTMATYLGAAQVFGPDDVDPATVEAAAVTYLEGYLFDPLDARRAFAKAAGLARGSGRKIALTLSDAFVVERHRAALLEFIEDQVDVLFANEAEIAALFGGAGFDACVAETRARARLAALTRGEKGSVIVAPEAVHLVEAAPLAEVVDTTGAGDQYAAGFLFGLARGLALPECGKLGSLAAAEVISHWGPRPQAPLKPLAAEAGLLPA
ncbi:MAG TPA: adenosine kinase [Caulobacteraceae bacterium]|jgi:sugar/nucleoside kinase (ribokinase family)